MFHILVVEDDNELRNLFCTVLEKKAIHAYWHKTEKKHWTCWMPNMLTL